MDAGRQPSSPMRPDESNKERKAWYARERRHNKKEDREAAVIEAGRVQDPTPEQARKY